MLKAERDQQMDIQSAYQSLVDIRRRAVANNTTIDEIDEQRTVKQQLDLQEQELGLAAKKYTQAWNLNFARKLHARLPPELRDMIYECLWQRPIGRPDQIDWRLLSDMAERLKLDDKADESEIQHFIDPRFVGREVAREILAKWYDMLPRSTSYPAIDGDHEYLNQNSVNCIDHTHKLVCTDIWGCGLIPADVLREMHIVLSDRALDNPAHGKKLLETLTRIKKKQGFQLNIEMNQCAIRLNLWAPFIEFFRPILAEFEREGAQVWIFWEHVIYSEEPVKFDLNEAIKDTSGSEKWRQDAIKYLDSRPSLDEQEENGGIYPDDRHYHYENDPRYNPSTFPQDLWKIFKADRSDELGSN